MPADSNEVASCSCWSSSAAAVLGGVLAVVVVVAAVIITVLVIVIVILLKRLRRTEGIDVGNYHKNYPLSRNSDSKTVEVQLSEKMK